MSIAEFLTQQETAGPISMTCKKVNANPNAEPDAWGVNATHWLCSFTFQDRAFSCYFSQGCAHKEPPTAEDVLGCLLSDARSVMPGDENLVGVVGDGPAVPFENWAHDLGLDPDSRKAERSYNVIVEQTDRLKNFLTSLLYKQALRISSEE